MFEQYRRNRSHIKYEMWLLKCSIQEYCLFWSLAVLAVETLLSCVKNDRITKFYAIKVAENAALPYFVGVGIVVVIFIVALLISYLCYILENWMERFTESKRRKPKIFVISYYIGLFAISLSFFCVTYKNYNSSTNIIYSSYFFMLSSVIWNLIPKLRRRHEMVFASYVAFVIGIWFIILGISDYYISHLIYVIWDGVMNLFFPNAYWDRIGSVLSMSITLLTGCLIIISWSPNQPCNEWNPFSASELMQSRRTATIGICLVTTMNYANMSGRLRVVFVCFCLLQILNVTIMLFCHVMQDHSTTRKYVVNYILIEGRKRISNPIGIYKKLSKVSHRVVSGIEKNGIATQEVFYEDLLGDIMVQMKKVVSGINFKHLRGVFLAIGFSIMPNGMNWEKTTPEALYNYCLLLYRYIRNCKELDTWRFQDYIVDLEDSKEPYYMLMLGILLSIIKMYDESSTWSQLIKKEKINLEKMLDTDILINESYVRACLLTLEDTMQIRWQHNPTSKLQEAEIQEIKEETDRLRSIFARCYANNYELTNKRITEFSNR